MKDFFTALLYAALAGGMATALVGKPYEKHLRYLSSLLCMALIIAPVLAALPQIELEEFAEEQISSDTVTAEDLIALQAAEDSGTAVENHIFSETGIKVKAVSIDIENVEGQLYFRKVKVLVHSEEDISAVEKCLEALVGGGMDTEVAYE